METKVKNREWVKDAAIIFLVVLLILTFFSNTIMNRTLPEVATAEVTNGAIVAKVRGSGTVTANGKHQVKAKEIRTIRSVMIKAGQEVNAGDVLFVLGEGDATALEQAKETLRDLQFAYQRMAVSTPTFNYTSYNRAITNAETAYQRALEKLEKARNERDTRINDPITKAALERYEAADAYARQLEEEYASMTEAKKKQLQEEIANLQDQLKPYEDAVKDKQDAVDTAIEAVSAAYAELPALEEALQIAEDEYNLVLKDVDDVPEDVFNLYYNKWLTAKSNKETAELNATAAEEALTTAQQALEAARSSEYYDIMNQIIAKQAELEAADDTAHYEEVKKALETRETLYYEYSNLAGSVEDDYQAAYNAAEDARNAVNAAYDDLYAAQQMNEQSLQASYVDLQQQAEKIRLQQEKIKSLAGDEENVITANVSGTVDTVDCTAGDTVLKDALLCTIEVPDMGHTLSFSVTNDQAQRLRIGDTATVSNYYWGNSITATLTTIRTDPKNPQTNKLLTFDLTGDVTTGAELTISVGQKSANYDLIVPNSAIKSDTNGNYVLAVSVKNSPLGNRYTARRVSVEVLANDDNNSAVVADLGNGDYVITTSSAPLSSGDMVRMADS